MTRVELTSSNMRRQRQRRDMMAANRKDVYLGDGLRRALKGRKESLSTSVNLIADRYMAIISWLRENDEDIDLSKRDVEMLKAVLATYRGRHIEGSEIHGFGHAAHAKLVELYAGDQEASDLGLWLIEQDFGTLLWVIDYLERQP